MATVLSGIDPERIAATHVERRLAEVSDRDLFRACKLARICDDAGREGLQLACMGLRAMAQKPGAKVHPVTSHRALNGLTSPQEIAVGRRSEHDKLCRSSEIVGQFDNASK